MSTTVTPKTEVPRLEDKTIQPIPANERHGKARDLFTIWFGSNIMIMTIVTGGLATTVFGLGFVPAIVGIIMGNVVGGIFMALHSAQGPQLGVAQMIQTRGQFGSFGALLIVVIVVIMYVGFFAANLVFGGEAMAAVSPGISVDAGIIIIGVVSVIATVFGYRLIHAYARVLSIAAGLALVLAFGWILLVHGLPASFLEQGNFNWVGFMGTISVAALWQLAYAPYVSDYSRYMPQGTGSAPAFWASYSGCVLGTLFPMILGALVGTLAVTMSSEAGDVEIVGSLGALLQPWTLIIVGIFCLGVAASNAMNLYCGVLCTLTIGQTFKPTWLPRAKTRSIAALILFVVAVSIALFARDNFILFYTNFLSFLMYVLVPWTAINLVDYYLLRHGDYRVEDFFKRDGGVYGRFNWVAIGSYVAGALIQVPFSATAVYTGPLAAAMGGVDISWIVGLVVVAPLYYFAALFFRKKTEAAPFPSTALTPDLI